MAELRFTESCKEIDYFKCAVEQGLGRNGVLQSEKVAREFERTTKGKVLCIGKLQLLNSKLIIKLNKLSTQIRQKEEMGEVLTAIDVHHIRIENQLLSKRIDERKNDIRHEGHILTSSTRKLQRVTNKLVVCTEKSTTLKTEIRRRGDMIRKLEAERVSLTLESIRAKKEVVNYGDKASANLPSVIDYARLKEGKINLLHDHKLWTRKVNTAILLSKLSEKLN